MSINLTWAFVALIIIAGMIGKGEDAEDQLAKDQKQYCEMVQTYIETNGRDGWQDYRGNFRRVCK